MKRLQLVRSLARTALKLTHLQEFARVVSGLTSAKRRPVRSTDGPAKDPASASAVSPARLEALFEHALDGMAIIAVNRDGSFSYEAVNPAEQAIMGLKSATMIGKGPIACLPVAVAEEMLQTWRTCARERRPCQYAMTITMPNRTFDIESSVAPITDETGRICRLIGVTRDVTERNKVAAQLRQTQKLEIVGQLAAGMAQDFNNLLQAIVSAVDLLGEQVGENERAQHSIAIARKAAYRGASLTHRLLTVSRQQSLSPALLDLRESLSEMVEVFTPVLGSHIQIEHDIEPRLWPIMADAQGVETCLMNLATNARDAMIGGGLLRLHLRNGRAAESGSPALPPGEYVVIGVEDTGMGMNPGTLARACDPFFTTKPPGKGSGLGLPMVSGFAAQSGGAMHIQSTVGRGTRVEIWLPRASGAPSLAQAGKHSHMQGCCGRILLVDDDPDVREILQILLTDVGYTVTPAENGEVALELVKDGSTFDVLISDYAMPGMTGAELVTRVLQIRPNLPALIITGFDATGPNVRLPSGVRLLRKPLRKQEFFAQVQAALCQSSSTSQDVTVPSDQFHGNVVPFESKNQPLVSLQKL